MESREDGPHQMAEVWVQFQREGWHNWPDAPEHRAYLRASHRHIFFYKVSVQVGTNEYDRGIEFHDLLDYCRDVAQGGDLGAQSCEMLAANLAEKVLEWLGPDPWRVIEVTVSEDNECGATVVMG